jgi:transcriptional regulator with XRE-family HTH domain
MPRMTSRERLLSQGTRRGERLMRELAEAAREARLANGLTLATVSSALDVSMSKLWRWEQAMTPHPDIVEAAQWSQIVGLDLSLKTYASGVRVRDKPQLRLLDRFRGETPLITWDGEAVVPIYGDQRAWDLLGRVGEVLIGVAAETRLRDTQALVRREHAKMRDSHVDRLILLVWGTRANRETLRDVRESLRADLPLDTQEIMSALRAGRDPGASGIVLL